MTATTTKPAPRRSALDRRLAMTLAATEYDRFADALEALTTEQWVLPTSCPGWDVRAMAGHCLGMAQMAASPVETVRQQRAASKAAAAEGGPLIDALTDLQVRKNAHLTTSQLVDAYRVVGRKAAAGRRRTPPFVRAMTMDDEVEGVPEKWTMGYLLDVVLTRDPWMHRSDIAVATGTAMHLTADHDGAIVADVVDEWARRHGRSYDLTLTGPAGGHWRQGADGTADADGERLELDAVAFCRVLSGRGEGSGLLATQVPF